MPLLADEDKAVARAYGVLAGPMVRRAIFVDRRGGRRPPPQGHPGRPHLRVGRRPRARASPRSADGRRRGGAVRGRPGAAICAAKRRGRGRRSSSATGSPRPAATSSTARGRWSAPATGSIAYDARGHGESDPAPAGEGYGYPRLVGDLERVVAAEVGEGRFVLAGHSMGAHTAVAYALRAPRAARRPGRDRAGLHGGDLGRRRCLLGRAGGGAGAGRSRRLRRLHRPRTRGSTRPGATRCCASPASGCCCTAISRRCVEALREVPRSRPFESLEELERLDVPALVVASHDDADPGHPYAVAAAYAERCRARG